MDTDLLTVARTLAERGWLPGIEWSDSLKLLLIEHFEYSAEESDLLASAMRQVRKINGTVSFGTLWVTLWIPDPEGIRKTTIYEQPAAQGDTLALLKCLLRACEEHECATTQASESKETNNGS